MWWFDLPIATILMFYISEGNIHVAGLPQPYLGPVVNIQLTLTSIMVINLSSVLNGLVNPHQAVLSWSKLHAVVP